MVLCFFHDGIIHSFTHLFVGSIYPKNISDVRIMYVRILNILMVDLRAYHTDYLLKIYFHIVYTYNCN